MEQLAAQETEGPASRTRRGASVSHYRYSTSRATVSLTFRKKDVTTDDILAALDEVRRQVSSPQTHISASNSRPVWGNLRGAQRTGSLGRPCKNTGVRPFGAWTTKLAGVRIGYESPFGTTRYFPGI
jgi:hypothetical protein